MTAAHDGGVAERCPSNVYVRTGGQEHLIVASGKRSLSKLQHAVVDVLRCEVCKGTIEVPTDRMSQSAADIAYRADGPLKDHEETKKHKAAQAAATRYPRRL